MVTQLLMSNQSQKGSIFADKVWFLKYKKNEVETVLLWLNHNYIRVKNIDYEE